MTERDNKLKIFEDKVDQVMNTRLIEAESKLRSMVGEVSATELYKAAVEVNSLIRLVCGGNVEQYEEFKYRVFVDANGDYIVIQAKEIDVDYYPTTNLPIDED